MKWFDGEQLYIMETTVLKPRQQSLSPMFLGIFSSTQKFIAKE